MQMIIMAPNKNFAVWRKPRLERRIADTEGERT